MNNRKKYLAVLLVFLLLLFFSLCAAGYFLIRYERQENEEIRKLDKLAELKQAELEHQTPTPAPTATFTPTPIATFTPTPVVEKRYAFDPDNFWNTWYSSNGRVTVNVYQIDEKNIGFSYHQISTDGMSSTDADVWAEIAGNGAELGFYDSWGNYAEGSIIFNGSELYLKVETVSAAGGAPVSPKVSSVMLRYQPEIQIHVPPAATPAVTPELPSSEETETPAAQSGEYFFADSNSRYLTEEDLDRYSSDELALAKNEIYARRGRIFVTDYISEYFNGKSWYQGTLDPDTFDAQQSEIFNEYELANIQKIAEWETRKREQGE